MDPLEIRLINGAKEGDRRADGPVHPRIGCIETVETAKGHPHYSAPNGKKHHGRGGRFRLLVQYRLGIQRDD